MPDQPMLRSGAPEPYVLAELQALDQSLATVVFAPDGTILRANALFLELFGYHGPDLIGRRHAILLAEDDARQGDDAAFRAASRHGSVRAAECRRVRKDGSRIWIEATCAPVTDASGQVREIVQFAADVTARKLRDADEHGRLAAIDRSLAVIHFAMDGTITHANDLFLSAMGYRLDEIAGRHHRLLVAPEDAAGAAYGLFWDKLAQGEPQSGEYKRVGKDGREVWLQAVCNPILDMSGAPFKIVEYATDVTRDRLLQADYAGQISAICKSQAVITFDMFGTVLEANDRFLEAVGYRFDEVEGRHHRMFIDPSYVHGPEYSKFWADLALGRHQAGEYKRVGKDGREVWLQATYNPVFDPDGRPFKVIKYATDVTREKLRLADHQGQIASIHKSQCVVSFSMDGTVVDANDNFLALTGYRLAEVRGRHHRMFVDGGDIEGAEYRAFWDDLAKGRHQASEYKRLCKDGREIWLQATYNPIFDMSGKPFKVMKYAIDVTQERLRQADHQGQIAAIHRSQCVATFDLAGVVLDANQNFLAATGYGIEEIRGRHHRMFVEADLAGSDEYAAFWASLAAGASLSARSVRVGKDGRRVWLQASYNPVLDLNGRPHKVIKIATDITVEVAADAARAADLDDAKQQATHDAATALPNRVRLASFMRSALEAPGARLAILFLDVDHFKPINDTFGHQVGDLVLSETAKRLRGALLSDQLVARVGGDEFVVAAPNLSEAEVEALCRRLIALVKAPIHYDRGVLAVGLSIGVAVSPDDAVAADDLLRCADVALYRSKGAGRGSYAFFSRSAHETVAADRHLGDDMLHGIKAGEFFLEYQPRFDARTKVVHGAEALVRWAHPERGRIEPAGFIPLAEESGLIMPIGEWVLRTACEAAAGWPDVRISVNVSPVQFRSSDLLATVRTVLAETGLAPGRLELEVAVGVLLEDEARARAALDALKALGVRLAMDDSWTGSSSIAYLRSFRFDAIKIDRRRIAGLEQQEGGREIVQSILALGDALGATVTAAGVETARQKLLLGLDDCSDVQGFHLAPPMSAAAVSDLLARHEREPAAAG